MLRVLSGHKGCDARGINPRQAAASASQAGLADQDVAQCGYCRTGQIMAVVAMLKQTSNPTDAEIDAIENVCRCGSYFRIRQAIKQAAVNM